MCYYRETVTRICSHNVAKMFLTWQSDISPGLWGQYIQVGCKGEKHTEKGVRLCRLYICVQYTTGGLSNVLVIAYNRLLNIILIIFK